MANQRMQPTSVSSLRSSPVAADPCRWASHGCAVLLIILIGIPPVWALDDAELMAEQKRFEAQLAKAVEPLGNSESSIQAMGTLLGKSIAPWTPQHSDNCCEMVTYSFHGLEVTAVVERATGRASISDIVITDKHWSFDGLPLIGSRIADVPFSKATLSTSPNEYCGETSCVQVYGDPVIEKIVVSLYVD